jgi:molybdopterin synthase catalytic subunit
MIFNYNQMIASTSYHPAVADSLQHLSAVPIDMAALLAVAHHPEAGAIVLFSGETRNNSNGKEVLYLDYEAQETMANKMIASILTEAKEKWKLNIATAQHRTGKVAVGETAVIVITASAHRSEAYAANRYIIDKIKHEAPIWKCEYFADGTKQWGGNCSCQKITGDPNKHIYELK